MEKAVIRPQPPLFKPITLLFNYKFNNVSGIFLIVY